MIKTFSCLKDNYCNSVFSAACIPSVFEAPPGALVLDAFKDGKISEVQENILHDPLSATLPAGSVHGVTLTPLQVPHILKTLFCKSQGMFIVELNRWNAVRESKLDDVIWWKCCKLSKPQRQYKERWGGKPKHQLLSELHNSLTDCRVMLKVLGRWTELYCLFLEEIELAERC